MEDLEDILVVFQGKAYLFQIAQKTVESIHKKDCKCSVLSNYFIYSEQQIFI